MKKILEFLIQFINDTHLDDSIEMTYEPNGDEPEIIVIRRIKEVSDD